MTDLIQPTEKAISTLDAHVHIAYTLYEEEEEEEARMLICRHDRQHSQ